MLSWGPLPSLHTHALTVTHAYTLSHIFSHFHFPLSHSHSHSLFYPLSLCVRERRCKSLPWVCMSIKCTDTDFMKSLSVSKKTLVSSNNRGRLKGWCCLKGSVLNPQDVYGWKPITMRKVTIKMPLSEQRKAINTPRWTGLICIFHGNVLAFSWLLFF